MSERHISPCPPLKQPETALIAICLDTSYKCCSTLFRGNASTRQHTIFTDSRCWTRAHAHTVCTNVNCTLCAKPASGKSQMTASTLCCKLCHEMPGQLAGASTFDIRAQRCRWCWLMPMTRWKIVIVCNASLVGSRTGLYSLISLTGDSKLIIKGIQCFDRGLFCAKMHPSRR
jgi:hypothetical protein